MVKLVGMAIMLILIITSIWGSLRIVNMGDKDK